MVKLCQNIFSNIKKIPRPLTFLSIHTFLSIQMFTKTFYQKLTFWETSIDNIDKSTLLLLLPVMYLRGCVGWDRATHQKENYLLKEHENEIIETIQTKCYFALPHFKFCPCLCLLLKIFVRAAKIIYNESFKDKDSLITIQIIAF